MRGQPRVVGLSMAHLQVSQLLLCYMHVLMLDNVRMRSRLRQAMGRVVGVVVSRRLVVELRVRGSMPHGL